jgi:CRP-like cAMP-binding protein
MAPDVSNDLIERLPRRDRTRLRAACERVELVLAAPVCVRGTAAGHAYFPTRAFISLLARVDHHPVIEVGMVGSEGMLGAEILLGIGHSPFDAVVQGQGEALRIDVRRFRTELESSLPLRRTLSRYLHVRMLQLARASGCHRFHAVAPRLARWLFAGSVVELVATIPLDVMVRRRTSCYCSEGTFWSLILAATASLAALGPMIFFLPVARRRQRAFKGLCPSCGYDRRSLTPQTPCPECGTTPMPQ